MGGIRPQGHRLAAIFHELIRVTFEDADPFTALPDILALVHPEHRDRYATVLAPDWHPDQATEFNGAVWPCLGSALWVLRSTTSFEDAIRAGIGAVMHRLTVGHARLFVRGPGLPRGAAEEW